MIRVRPHLLGTACVLLASTLMACGGDESTVAPAPSNGGTGAKGGAGGASAGSAGATSKGGAAGTGTGGTSAGGTSAGGTSAGGTSSGGFAGTGPTGGTTSSGGSSTTAGAGGTTAGTGGTTAGTGGTTAGTGGTTAGTGGTTAGTGGSTAGTGGTTAGTGGTDAGGTNAGGTDAGGNSAGGTDAGGNNAGGNAAGGSDAGGSAGAAGGCNADELLCNGICINPATNTQNCGGCDKACEKGETCEVGICNGGCQGSETACGLTCVDLNTDEAHCGTCNTVCPASSECTNGVCKLVCQGGESDCSGTCKDLAKDNANCGSCGTVCGPTEKCSAGVCQTTCDNGTTQCGAQCVDQQTDEANCGGCGVACPAAQTCNAGKCACPTGQTLCGNQCVDLQSDEANCGTCGTKCAANTQTCNAGVCTDTCESKLIGGNPFLDPWGFSWDRNERTLATAAAAEADCAAIGGRLPTASEVYRVSAVRTSEVGQSDNVNPLWTNVPAGTANQLTVRLSTGVVASTPVGTATRYRCVCAPPKTEGYQGRDCHGSNGPNCTERTQHGTTYAIDNADRAKLTLSQAEWECQFDGGQLPSAAEYAELTNRVFDVAGASGLPVTTARWTSDSVEGATQITAARNASNATVISSSTNTTPQTFRCMGAKRIPATSTGPANGFVHPGTGVRLDATEKASTTYVGAVDLCLASGGHIPSTQDLADAVFAGASGGALPLWASEHGAADSVVRLKWLATQPRWTWTNGGLTTAATTGVQLFSKSVNAATPQTSNYRCSYYPVEAGYVGPDAATCADQGCLETSFAAGAGKPKLWVDKTDRQAATWANASRTCAGLGGHLATREDLVVSIRNGLTFGTGASVWTSDLATTAAASVVKWSGVQSGFDDRTLTTTVTTLATSSTAVFRCAWTNEVR